MKTISNNQTKYLKSAIAKKIVLKIHNSYIKKTVKKFRKCLAVILV